MSESKQPLHPSVISKLDAEYVDFHNETLQFITPPHTLPWDPAIRNAPAVPGGSPLLEVEQTKIFDLTHTNMITFVPKGVAPEAGWPVFIWFHGGTLSTGIPASFTHRQTGGWTFGTINSETSFATNIAVRSNCVVLSVNYRLAPEDKYPKAVEDAVESLDWVIANGKKELNIDTSKIAVGGSSR